MRIFTEFWAWSRRSLTAMLDMLGYRAPSLLHLQRYVGSLSSGPHASRNPPRHRGAARLRAILRTAVPRADRCLLEREASGGDAGRRRDLGNIGRLSQPDFSKPDQDGSAAGFKQTLG